MSEDVYCAWCGQPLLQLSLTESVLPFYPERAGEELEGALTLVNSGTRSAEAKIHAPAEFVLDETRVELAPNTPPHPIPFTFRAPAMDNWQTQIRVDVTDGQPLRATVLCAIRPRLRLAENTLALLEGESGPFPVALRHQEGGPAFITAVRARGGGLQVLSGSGPLLPGGDLVLSVQFPGGAPARRGMDEEVLEVDLLNAGRVTLPLSITIEEQPRMEVSTTHLDFGDVIADRSRRKVLRLTNGGGGALQIHQVSLLDNDGAWSLELPAPLPIVLRRAGETDLTVCLRQKTEGPTEARLMVVTDDPQHPSLQVPLNARILTNPPEHPRHVGIDFGTTNSCICVRGPGDKAHTLVLDEMAHNAEERLALPSCVYWPKPPVPGNLRDCIVGQAARAFAGDPARAEATAVSIKRKLGQRHPERILGVPLMPQEIAARIIRRLLDSAEDYLSARITKAVVTVPANFTPPQVRATVQACEMAGLSATVVSKQMLDEPVGAAMDYLAKGDRSLSGGFHALVYDFGGGTLDISIIHSSHERGIHRLEVLATKGDNAFGGDDLTELLCRDLQRRAESLTGGQVPADRPEQWEAIPSADLRRKHYENFTVLTKLAENMKRQLSDRQVCEDGRELWVLMGREMRRAYVKYRVTRQEYEELVWPRLKETRKLVDGALRAAQLREEEISLVLLVGQSSRTPLVARLLGDWFGLTPVLHPEPKVCVARGAYVKGETLDDPEEGTTVAVRELDRTNCQYGIILMRQMRRRFQPIIGERVPFPAAGSYPHNGEHLSIHPGARVTVALNRGDSDDAVDNPEISPLGEIIVNEEGDEPLPLRVALRVENHRTVSVQLHVGNGKTQSARFEEF